MRKILTVFLPFIFGVSVVCFFAFKSQESVDHSLAKVQQVDGKYVFINCTPSSAYETAFEFTTVVHGFGGCPSINECAEASVKSAKKKGFPFDAIILGSTKTDLAIRFK